MPLEPVVITTALKDSSAHGVEKKRNDYTFWRQFSEKYDTGIIPGWPVPVREDKV